MNTGSGRKYWVFDLNSMDELGYFETKGEALEALINFREEGVRP